MLMPKQEHLVAAMIAKSWLLYGKHARGVHQSLDLELHDSIAFPISCSVLCQLLLQLCLHNQQSYAVTYRTVLVLDLHICCGQRTPGLPFQKVHTIVCATFCIEPQTSLMALIV